ncbi:conserved hypothetical protein [Flavobacterium sp. 9AF]|uniref:hypothetical protein n=1 Tax=Flavobacterium sp. 9AF TaxID=2653142 RepID=UPI0012F302F9|nr:hypothetical protein [Flavobacterium sp. 9AF]VXB41464.1 conserved hypothetical protein [Flavobacterium sp. 9AF]
MKKSILNLIGVTILSKKQQRVIKGQLKDCIDPMTNQCKYYSLACADPCRI